jgi:hypothetical protein
MRISDILTILAKFPGVRVFSSDYTAFLRNLTPLQESSIFPVLEQYTGSYKNLPIFVQRPTLTHFTIDAGSPCSKLLTELPADHLEMVKIFKIFTASGAWRWTYCYGSNGNT